MGGVINGGTYIWWGRGACKWNKKNVSEQRDEMYLRNELKQTPLHLELNFDDTLNFIVHHDKWRMYLKNI